MTVAMGVDIGSLGLGKSLKADPVAIAVLDGDDIISFFEGSVFEAVEYLEDSPRLAADVVFLEKPFVRSAQIGIMLGEVAGWLRCAMFKHPGLRECPHLIYEPASWWRKRYPWKEKPKSRKSEDWKAAAMKEAPAATTSHLAEAILMARVARNEDEAVRKRNLKPS